MLNLFHDEDKQQPVVQAEPAPVDDEPYVLDLETTGHPQAAVIDLCIVGVRTGKVVFDSLFRCPRWATWNPHAERVHGIPRWTLSRAPSFWQQEEVIRSHLKNRIIIGHNIASDLRALKKMFACDEQGRPRPGVQLPWASSICTLDLARKWLTLQKNSLSDVAVFLKVPVPAKLHRAQADALLNREVYLALRSYIQARRTT